MNIKNYPKSKKITLIIISFVLIFILVGMFYLYTSNPANRQYSFFRSLKYPSDATVVFHKNAIYILDCFDECAFTSVELNFNNLSNEKMMTSLISKLNEQGYALQKAENNCFPSSPGNECIYTFNMPKTVIKCLHISAVYKTSIPGNIGIYCDH